MEKTNNVSIYLSNNKQSKGGNKLTKKSVFKKVFTTALALGIAATAFTTQSFAANTSSTITGGTLHGGDMVFNPLAATLDGTSLTTSANWEVGDVVDARGTGFGWELTLNLSQFKEVDEDGQYVEDGKAIEMGSLFVSTEPTVTKLDATSSEVDTITPVALNTALDTNSDVKILSAIEDGGMGSYGVSDLGVTLVIPANAYAKTYKTDATVSLNTAP